MESKQHLIYDCSTDWLNAQKLFCNVTHHLSTNRSNSPVWTLVIEMIPRRKLRVWSHLWLCQIVIFSGWNRNWIRLRRRWLRLIQTTVHIDLLLFHVHQNAWRMTSERWSFLDQFVIFSLWMKRKVKLVRNWTKIVCGFWCFWAEK